MVHVILRQYCFHASDPVCVESQTNKNDCEPPLLQKKQTTTNNKQTNLTPFHRPSPSPLQRRRLHSSRQSRCMCVWKERNKSTREDSPISAPDVEVLTLTSPQSEPAADIHCARGRIRRRRSQKHIIAMQKQYLEHVAHVACEQLDANPRE
jgi:hypothetical protein